MEEGINISQNLAQFQEKYKNLKKDCVTDSLHFNANPTINGVVDTYGSINASSKSGNYIDSFNSVNRQKPQNQAIKNLKQQNNARKRSSIYKYALMKGGKGVDFQKELEKMGNVSMDSYQSEGSNEGNSDSDSNSNSEGNNKNIRTPQGGKSRFAH